MRRIIAIPHYDEASTTAHNAALNAETHNAEKPIVGQPIKVLICARGQPKSVIWNERLYHVLETKTTWLIDGRWWLDPARIGTRRRYYRLTIASRNHLVDVEVFQQIQGQADFWRLWRVLD